MNDDLAMLINAKRVDLVDARRGTTDPLKFAEMFERGR
jgi:hypothetical protein